MQYSDPATGFLTGTDEPDLDVMRYATQVAAKRQQPTADAPVKPFEKIASQFAPPAPAPRAADPRGEMRATPVQNPAALGVSGALQSVHNFVSKPFGYENPPAEMLSNFLGVPAVAKTLERIGYGEPLTTGAGGLGGTTRPREETIDAALSVAPLAPMTKGLPVGLAVKAKGGNWAPQPSAMVKDTVDQAMARLKMAGPTHRDEALVYGGDWATHADTPEGKWQMENNAALNKWVDKKLNPYVRNEMGTPDDPILLAHEKGYSHIPGSQMEDFGSWLPEDTASARRKAGFPEEGFAVQKHAEAGYPAANEHNVRKAELWENLSDTEIKSLPARDYQNQLTVVRDHPSLATRGDKRAAENIEQNAPWIKKLDPKTPIHELHDPVSFGSNLGFDHLMDELRNSIDPTSGLPANLRLTAKQLDKVTVGDAVERVHKIGEWRTAEAEKAEREGMMGNLSANARLEDPTTQLSFVDKPGMKWVDIPETTDTKGRQLCTTIGKQGGWCTQGEGLAKAYGSGDNRLTALVDAEGRPHAQAMISSKDGAQDVKELKPVGNDFTSARGREYAKRDPQYESKVTDSVLKFLNSGEWGKVNDLEHYNIVDMHNPSSVQKMLKDTLDYDLPQERIDKFNVAVEQNPQANRFMSPRQFREFVDPPPAPAPVPEQKMLQGFYRGYAGENAATPELFASPQKRIADYYAQKRAAQTGEAPHAEMILADPFAGRTYGHATAGTGANPPMETRAKKLKPEDVKGRTQLYAKGGAVHFAKTPEEMRYELTRKK